MKTFGINGFGRIGRTAMRVWWYHHRHLLNLKMINTSGSMDLEAWAHLLKYDSNYGRFSAEISTHRHQSKDDVSDQDPVLGTLTIQEGQSSHTIVVTAQKDPTKIPWGDHQVETVVESTGVFTAEEKAAQHFQGGAQYVLLSGPPKEGNISSAVISVNEFQKGARVLSNVSCTTNCVAPVTQVINDVFGIEQAMLTTIHSYTDDQNIQDNSNKDLRRARAAAENIIPTSTGAARAVTKIIPELVGKFDGLAIRVPTPVGSLSDTVFVTKRPTTIEAVNQAFVEATQEPRYQGILAVTTDPIVSSDIIGRSESAIVDLPLTNVIGGTLVKVISWYDNEWGYCNRLIEQLHHIPSSHS